MLCNISLLDFQITKFVIPVFYIHTGVMRCIGVLGVKSQCSCELALADAYSGPVSLGWSQRVPSHWWEIMQ